MIEETIIPRAGTRTFRLRKCQDDKMPAEKPKHKSQATTRWPPAASPGPSRAPWGQTPCKGSPGAGRAAAERAEPRRLGRRGARWAAAPPQMPGTARLPVGLRSPARGANHLCHTVTIILHKIIIKNPNFSASNPASGLLAFFSASVCRPVITALITAVWGLPPRASNQALITPARGPGAGGPGGRGPGSGALGREEDAVLSRGVAGSGSAVLGVPSESQGRGRGRDQGRVAVRGQGG